MKTGFIGLGHMGVGMAANLLKAGHEITVYNRSPGKAQPLLTQGAKAAARVSDACNAEVVFTMLADDAAVENVTFGEGGILRHLPKGAIHISCSTIGVALSARLAAAHADAGQEQRGSGCRQGGCALESRAEDLAKVLVDGRVIVDDQDAPIHVGDFVIHKHVPLLPCQPTNRHGCDQCLYGHHSSFGAMVHMCFAPQFRRRASLNSR